MTIMLRKESFVTAQCFIEANARPLDVALWRFYFSEASTESVLSVLRRYQNPDGGFGHALEPDLRATESSALCTSIAFQIFRTIAAKPDDSMVAQAVSYLLRTLDRARRHWRIIPTSADASPHAPWWNQAGREDTFNSFSLNPTAEILGYLYDFPEHVSAEIVSLVSDRVMVHLSDLDTIEMHELLCCLRLLQTRNLPQTVREQVRHKLTELIKETVACDPTQWKGYSLRPLQVVQSPDSPFMDGLEEAVDANLDYEIASQSKDGSWTPTWTWGDAYPDDWKKARLEWSGVITLEKLLKLTAFNRIEKTA
ncbi:MAG: hypothetical protein GFH27_549321n22 [Chloroflexi bacterium AL-W]|nr:hypothetical protein [Chloroflexi bacterium AL-N1]NOK64900.1 hypothetical protein [Chloroflexi bacterium AL-N10]NOK76670.1 hypothetical protein [Chloroflexi bacterium AL-N5]NOK84561.1 hypothetical protein [Chloroflexi bacterium AL-W]NOK86614.1 hypothetical protein [Chloroflexi bacterium AL-N15]